MKPTIYKAKDGILILKRNGKNLICPFASPVMMRDGLGNPGQALQNCSSRCPHFQIEKGIDQSHRVTLTCGNEQAAYLCGPIETESSLTKA